MTISVSRVFYMIPEPDQDDEEADSLGDDKQNLFDLPDVSSGGSRSSSCLSPLHIHDCLVNILDFLSFTDMNNFSRVSKECYNVRCHKKLDQTRSGTISLGKGVQSIVELMLKVREQEWHKSFRGNRTHLHLEGLNCLSSDIESIDEQFIKQCSPLKHVTSLDCSEVHLGNSRSILDSSSSSSDEGEAYSSSSSSSDDDINGNTNENNIDDGNGRQLSSSVSSSLSSSPSSSGLSWLFRYQDYIDKGFAHGLALSLLVPNLREIDMSYLPLTSLGVAWIAENNPKLERIRWNRSLIWPINHHDYDILRACRNLKELYIDDARLLFGPGHTRRRLRRRYHQEEEELEQQQGMNNDNVDDNDNEIRIGNIGNNVDQDNNNEAEDDVNNDAEALWSSLLENIQSLVRVSCRRARWYTQNSKFITIGETEEGQESLMRFVRSAGKLKWFRSDLTDENVAILEEERPDIVFCR
jgi:hypothetical protein